MSLDFIYVRLHGELLLFDLLPGVITTVRVALRTRIELSRLKRIHALFSVSLYVFVVIKT